VTVALATQVGSWVNTASITGNEPDPNLANNTASAAVAVTGTPPPTPSADLAVTKLGPAVGTVDQPLTYTLVVTNHGPDAAHAFASVDILPAGVTFDSSSLPPVAGSPGSLTFDLGTIASGGTETVTIVVTPHIAGTIMNQAVVSSPIFDPDLSNNVAPPVVTAVAPAPVVATTVTSLSRYGFHNQPTALALSFSAPLDPATAQNLSNYQLVLLGAHNRPVRVIPIASATYQAAREAVVLQFHMLLALHARYRLTVNGSTPGGVTDAEGHLIDGAGTGQPGSDYVKTFGPEILVNSNPPTTSPAQLRQIQREVAAVVAREQAANRHATAQVAASARAARHAAAVDAALAHVKVRPAAIRYRR
jgi:uncharacterized repeat protein (TIGR01451 family)